MPKVSQLISGEAGIQSQFSLNSDVCLCGPGVQNIKDKTAPCPAFPSGFVSLNREAFHLCAANSVSSKPQD